MSFHKFPSHNIPNSQKNEQWVMKFGKGIWSEWKDSTFWDQREQMVECQLYSKGQQKTGKYKKLLDQEEQQGYLNLDWTPVPILPKYVDIVVGKILRTGLRLEAESIDQLGIDAKNYFRHNKIAIIELQKRMQDSAIFQQMFGTPMEMDDIEVFMEMGYKDSYEVAAEDAIKTTDMLSSLQDTFRGFIKNIVVEGKGAVKTYTDDNGIVKYRKVNPIEFVHSSTSSPNFDDAYYFGEVVYYTISDLKLMDTEGKIKGKQWDVIAENVAGKHGNPATRVGSVNLFRDISEVQYDSFRVACLDFEFKSHKNIVHSKKEGKHQTIIKKRTDEYQAPEGVETMKKSVSTWFKGFWLIDTDHILNAGEATNMARGDKSSGSYSKAYSNFIAYAPSIEDGDSQLTSIVRRAIPFTDGLQVAWLNYQNVIARAAPKGGYVDAGALTRAAEVMGLKDSLDILKIFKSKGWMVGYPEQVAGSTNKPIQELENGLGKDFGNYIMAMEFNIGQIREVTGINQIVDASTPSSGTLVGTAKLAEAATNNSLVPLLVAKKSVRERLGKCTAKKVQSLILARAMNKIPLPPIYQALGKLTLSTLETASEFAMSEFAIKVKNEPSEEEMTAFYTELERAVQNQEITTAQSLKAKELAAESIKRASAFLTKEIRKNKQEAQEAEQRNMMLNQQVQQASIQASAQAEQQKIQMEMQKEISIINAEYDRKERLEMVKARNEQALERVRSDEKKDQAGLNSALSITEAQYAPKTEKKN